MKTLLFNGCSFVAGDALVWDDYCLKNNRLELDWNFQFGWNPKRTHRDDLFYANYRSYRKEHNLSALIGKNIQLNVVDISKDSNSNDMIALSSIMYLSNMTLEQRRQYHVCIGWTALSRLFKYVKACDHFVNLNSLILKKSKLESGLSDVYDYVISAIAKAHNEDFFVNYIKNLMLLENFLIANNISYTFFKSLGSFNDTTDIKLNSASENMFSESMLLSNPNNWYKFDNEKSNHLYPYLGSSWFESVIKDNSELCINSDNKHPNLKAVNEFSIKLADFIKNQNIHHG